MLQAFLAPASSPPTLASGHQGLPAGPSPLARRWLCLCDTRASRRHSPVGFLHAHTLCLCPTLPSSLPYRNPHHEPSSPCSPAPAALRSAFRGSRAWAKLGGWTRAENPAPTEESLGAGGKSPSRAPHLLYKFG